MKKNYLFLIAAAFAALAISCSKELEDSAEQESVIPEPEENISGEYTLFTATVEGTKSAFGDSTDDGFEVIWNEWNDGKRNVVDSVVVNGRRADDVTLADDGKGMEFKVQKVDPPYFAVVGAFVKDPDDTSEILGNYNPEKKTIQVNVKGPVGPQKYYSGTYDPTAVFMVGYSENEPEFTFRHMTAFLELTVDPESADKENIRWVYIHDGDGGNIAGTWKFDFRNPSDIKFTLVNPTKPIAYSCGNSGIPAGAPMYIAIPAYNYTKGLIITVKDVNNHFSSFKVKPENADFSEKAGVITKMKVKLEPKPGVINSAQDWEDFVTFTKSSKYKNDYDIYKWVGDGTVRIGKDFTFTKEQTRLTGMDGMGLQYDLDGGGHTITFDCDTRYSLFRGLRATVKNLNIAATPGHSIVGYQGGASAFADTLYPGGKLINCTNNMPINISANDISLDAGAFVKYNAGGYLEGCVNNATIRANCIATKAPTATSATIRVGGIAATMGTVTYNSITYGAQLCGACDMEMKDCTNNGTIEVTPVVEEDGTHNNGYVVFAVGGVVGWLRGHASFGGQDYEFMKTLNNCDNTGAINVYGDKITSSTGLNACAVSVGGIAGLAAPLKLDGTLKEGKGRYPLTETNGLRSKFINCDNSGNIYNCVTNYCLAADSDNKVYTAGLVGALLGTSANYAEIDNCTNTGAVVPYDLVTGDVATPSVRSAYCSVVSGLLGFCGYVDIKNSTVCCKVGTTKRPVVAIGGITAWAMRPIKINDCKSYIEGSFTRIAYYQSNRALAVNVPVTNMSPAPSVSGSELKNCNIDWKNTTSTDTMSNANDTSDQTSKLTTVMTYAVSNLVFGQGYKTKETDWTISGVSQWADHPAAGTLPSAD